MTRPTYMTIVAALVLAFCAACGGCAVFGAAAYKLFGPEPVPPRYAPPKELMLVLVEEANPGAGTMLETEELALTLHQELKDHDVAPLVDPKEVHRLRDIGPVAFKHMSITDVARRLGAKQVLYVAVKHFELETPPTADVIRARIAADIKFVDAQTAGIRWPATGDSEPYETETPYVRITPENTQAAIRSSIIQQTARDIGRWFYTWKPESASEENRDIKIR
jgi:hypothetical protein